MNGSIAQDYDRWTAFTDFDRLNLVVPSAGGEAPARDVAARLEPLGIETARAGEMAALLRSLLASRTTREASDCLLYPKSIAIPWARGLGGPPTLQYLYATLAADALDGLGGFNLAQIRIVGRIRNFVYAYDPETRRGPAHLAVDVETIYPNGWTEFLHWAIDATLETHERADSEDDPFPKVDLALDDRLRLKTSASSIWQRGLDLKLHARGDDIRVHHVFQRIGYGRIERLPNEHPFYQSSAESCVDLLAASFGPDRMPPTTYHELRRFLPGEQRPLYCLGRCAHPAIINSGH